MRRCWRKCWPTITRTVTCPSVRGYLEQAGDEACAQHGRAAAAGFYHDAVERRDRMGQPLEAARVREKLGAVLRSNARYADALATLGLAAEAYRAGGDLEAVGRVVVEISGVHSDRGTPAEGLAHLQYALALLAERGPSQVLAGLYTTQADLLYMLGRLHDDLAATAQAERIARMVGDDGPWARPCNCAGSPSGCWGACRRPARRCRRPSRGSRRRATISSCATRCGCWVSFARTQGAFATARETTERALQLAERHGFRMQAACATMQHGWIAFLTGDWAMARRDLERALDIGGEVGPLWGSVYLPLALGSLCMAEGADAAAGRHLEEGERLLRTGDRAHARRQVACVLAARDLLAGHSTEARTRLTAVLEDEAREHDATAIQSLLALALLDLGEVTRPRRWR